jgi:hypothetical protein
MQEIAGSIGTQRPMKWQIVFQKLRSSSWNGSNQARSFNGSRRSLRQ